MAQLAGEVNRGFSAAAEVRYGIFYEVWAGGRSCGRYMVVDRVLSHTTA